MKKFLPIMVFAAIFIFMNNFCFAEVSKDVSLGGIRLGMSYQEVVSMYGEPTAKYERVKDDGSVTSKYIEYGNTVQITFSSKNGNFGIVKNVLVTADNGFSLPSGIKVGSTVSDFTKIYGSVTSSGKGICGLYYRINISNKVCIAFSTTDIGDRNKINSLQITTGSVAYDFAKNLKSLDSKIRRI